MTFGRVRTEPYEKKVIRARPDATGTVYLRYWGAIGDYMFFLTFVSPFLREKADKRRVLAADVYSNYPGQPTRELCRANGLIDELWTHKRKDAGPTLVPPEYLEQALHPKPGIELMVPAVYYDKYLVGPGVLPYPVEKLRQHMKMEKKYLIPIPDWSLVQETFPQLRRPYVTYHHETLMKKKRNVIPSGVLAELATMGTQIVIMVFRSDARRIGFFHEMGKLPNVEIIPVSGPMNSLWIQAHAACHVGVESSQLLGATIHDVPTFFFPFGGYPAFDHDLCLAGCWTVLDWDVSPKQLKARVEEVVHAAVC